MGRKTKGNIMRKTVYFLIGIILFVVLASFMQRNTRYYSVRDIGVKEGAWYDVRMYGAIAGDEISDVTAIQAALDSCANDGGGTVFFPPGQYEFYGDSVVVGSNTTVSAYGAVFNDTTGGAEFFRVDGDSDIVFMGGEWDGNADVDGGYTEHNHGISINNAFRVTVKDIYTHDLAGDGVYIADSDDITVTNSIIVSTHLQDSPFLGRNSVAIVEGNNIKIVNNILKGGDPANVDIEPNENLAATNILISNNIMTGGEFGVSLSAGASGATVDSVKVVNNIISNATFNGVHVTQATHYTIITNTINSSSQEGIRIKNSGGGTAGHLGNISNNDIYNSGSSGGDTYPGILLGAGLKNISVIGNRVSYSEASGIRIAGSPGSENNWITVRGNICWNNDRNDNGNNAGIYINYTDSSFITDNTCYDDQASPTQAFGFRFSQMDVIYTNMDNVGYGNKTRLYSWDNITADRLNQVVSFSWIVDNPAAGAGNIAMNCFGSQSVNQVVMPWDGQIIAMTATTTTNLDAETITFNLVKNGSAGGMNSVQLTSSILKTSETYFAYTDAGHAFSAGDLIGVIYTTTGSYAPTTLDYVVTVYIRY